MREASCKIDSDDISQVSKEPAGAVMNQVDNKVDNQVGNVVINKVIMQSAEKLPVPLSILSTHAGASGRFVPPNIQSLLPHSGVMVLLDRFIFADEERLCAEVAIRPDSLFMGADGVGSWVGVEYMAQAIAAFAGYRARIDDNPVKVGFLLGTRRYEASCGFFPLGAVLHILVKRLMQADNGLGSFECAIYDATDGVDEMKRGTVAGTLFDLAGEPDNVHPLVRATITVFQPHDVTGFLEGMME